MIAQKNSQLYKTLVEGKQKFSIAAVTWNMHGSVPPLNSLIELYKSSSFNPLPDLILFSTQECQNPLWLTFCLQAKDEWSAMLAEVFKEYEIVSTEVMRGLHTAILVKRTQVNFYSMAKKDRLRSGTCNLMGNKGAISIQFLLFGRQMQIINCHLAPHQTKSQLRNFTINRILNTFLNKGLQSQIIFMGDFNYRIDMSKGEYEMMILNKNNNQSQMNYSSLLGKEQLINQKDLRERFLLQFQEGAILFPPTYKMATNSNTYHSQRIPGWTDRIFAKKTTSLNLISYLCEYNILGCDHRPVVARYQAKIDKKNKLYPSSGNENTPNTSNNCVLI